MPMLVFIAMLAGLAALAIVGLILPARVLEGLPELDLARAARDSLYGKVSLGFDGMRFGSALTGEATPLRTRSLLDQPRLSAAQSLLESAHRSRRFEPRIVAALGHVALASGDYAGAERRYRAALDLRASCAEARLGLGVTLARDALLVGDLIRARALRLQAIAQLAAVPRASRWYEDALYDRALLLPEVGRRAEARRLGAEYLAQDSTSAWAAPLREALKAAR
jgi:Flp pilus assembly protein TadD